MGHHKLFRFNPKTVRDSLNDAIALTTHIHEQEQVLIKMLSSIDRQKFHVRFGYNSLTGFCRYALKFSRTQSQRIVTQVRRYDPTANFVDPRG